MLDLTIKELDMIKGMYYSGNYTIKQIAEKIYCSRSTITNIINLFDLERKLMKVDKMSLEQCLFERNRTNLELINATKYRKKDLFKYLSKLNDRIGELRKKL